MGLVVYGVGLILGVIFFFIVNSLFEIYYLGFKGIASTFMGCWFAGVIVVALFGGIALWVVIVCAVIWILLKIFGGGKTQGSKKA